MTKTRLNANQASAGVATGPSTKKIKNSLGGAAIARIKLLQDGLAEDTVDALKVSPLSGGSRLWNWTQPVLSTGGHIVGAPVAVTKIEEATRMGVRMLEGLLEGKKYEKAKPEYALPVLLVLLRAMENSSELDGKQVAEFLGACAYSAEAKPEDAAAKSFKQIFLSRLAHANVADFLEVQELHENHSDADAAAPRWRAIKDAVYAVTGTCCSNKFARFIRRLMVTKFPRLCKKQRIIVLRDFILSPLRVRDSHPVTEFIERCWSMRGSSISCSLPKTPPPLVNAILSAYGLGVDRQQTITADDSAALRAVLMSRFEAFGEWTLRLHGGGTPAVWSDTLSKFASCVNPAIQRYNKMNGVTRLAQVTSFVPADLAPEMYVWYGSRATGYFFYGRGLYYCYSAGWRRDAVQALLLGLLPRSVDALVDADLAAFRKAVDPALAYKGGDALLQVLKSAGFSEETFTCFLRQYYWSGAFLVVNKKILRQEMYMSIRANLM